MKRKLKKFVPALAFLLVAACAVLALNRNQVNTAHQLSRSQVSISHKLYNNNLNSCMRGNILRHQLNHDVHTINQLRVQLNKPGVDRPFKIIDCNQVVVKP